MCVALLLCCCAEVVFVRSFYVFSIYRKNVGSGELSRPGTRNRRACTFKRMLQSAPCRNECWNHYLRNLCGQIHLQFEVVTQVFVTLRLVRPTIGTSQWSHVRLSILYLELSREHAPPHEQHVPKFTLKNPGTRGITVNS